MAEVTTTKPVNLYQLGQEIGGSPSFRMIDSGTQRTVSTDSTSQQTLAAAIEAHTADPNLRPPSALLAEQEQTNRAAIEDGVGQGLAAMQQIIDAPQVTFSNLSQAQAAVRDIQTAVTAEARQLRRLTRLALNLLDGTD